MGTRFGGDLIFGTGLRNDLPLANSVSYPDGNVLTAIPNGGTTPAYVQVNLALSHTFDLGPAGTLQARFDQPVRRSLPNPRRLGRGRVRAAVRTAAWLVRGNHQKLLSARASG